LPAVMGQPINVSSAIDKINDPAFATVIGLVIWGKQMRLSGSGGGLNKLLDHLPDLNSFKKFFKR